MFTVDELKALIDALDQSSLNELSLSKDGNKLKLKKQQPFTYEQQNIPVTYQMEQAPQPVVINNVEDAVLENNASVQAYDHVIKSPMVGTFYMSSSPEAEPFVTVGEQVTPKTTVCMIEAMKLFNELEAEVTGEVVEVLAKNGELVEYNQPLFGIKTK